MIRPEKARRCVEAIRAHAGIPADRYEVVTEFDTDRIGCPKMVKRLVSRSVNPLVCFLGDDTIPQEDFLRNALAAMAQLPDGWGLVGLNDLYHTETGPFTHWLADKRLLDHLDGEFFHTGYNHAYCDNELKDRALELGRCGWAKNAVVKHDNPVVKKEPLTDEYAEVYSKENMGRDEWLYKERKIKRKLAAGIVDLGLGLPITDSKVFTSFFTSFATMQKPDSCALLMPTFPGHIDAIRNTLVMKAVHEECTHLVMMDTDQNYPPDTITKLLSHKKDVVAGAVHRRYPPFDLILYTGGVSTYTHLPDETCYSGDLVEVSATGCGCVLYSMNVFFDIEKPWFETGVNQGGKVVGEDIGFCIKLKEAGYPIFVDTSIEIGHVTLFEVTRSTYELFKKMKGYEWRPPEEDGHTLIKPRG